MTDENKGNFTSCAHLANPVDVEFAEKTYAKLLDEGSDPLQTMLNLQYAAQNKLSDTLPHVPRPQDLKTCGEKLDWMRLNDDAIADETRELYTALGGMSRGEKPASAVWKPWKAQHLELRAINFDDMSESDQLEAKFELIDQWHFILSKFLGMGMDADEIFKLYAVKQAENLRRWANSY